MTESPDAARESAASPAGPFQTATELLMGQVDALTKMTTAARQQTLSALGGSKAEASVDALALLQRLVTQVPAPMAQLDRVLAELQTRRAQAAALQAQLAAFEQQLEVLERALRPMQEWGRQWSTAQRVMTDALRPFGLGGSGPTPSAGE